MVKKTMAEILKEVVKENPTLNKWLLWDKAQAIRKAQDANSK